MKLRIETRPTVVDQNGAEVTMGQSAFVVMEQPLQMVLSAVDVTDGVEVAGIGEHLAEIVSVVLNYGNPTMIQNMYRDIGGALRCVTSEENAEILVKTLGGKM